MATTRRTTRRDHPERDNAHRLIKAASTRITINGEHIALDLSGLNAFDQELVEQIAASLRTEPIAGALAGVGAGSAARIAGEMVRRLRASMPSPGNAAVYNDLLGPFYDAGALAEWRGKTKQSISKLRRTMRVIGLDTDKGRVLYPAFQFGPNGELLPHLSDVLRILESGPASQLANARWLNTPSRRFEGRTAAELLRDGQVDTVLMAAQRDVMALRGDRGEENA